MCSQNSLNAVYLYDEQGRTIATSTDKWYFTVSRNIDDQSNEFLQVIDGRADSLVQMAGTDEVGERNQYIGVRMAYYTCTEENDWTHYVSCWDYERYLNGKWDGPPITCHSGMLEIALSSKVMDQVHDSAAVTTLLDNISVMDNGSLIVFDATEDHNVLYSFNPQYTGMKAESLGISNRTFKADYNGFVKLNGEESFLCVRYEDGAFVGTLIPTRSLYTMRLPVSIVTTLFGFVVLAGILLLLVSSSEEDEQLKEMLVEEVLKEKAPEPDRITITMPGGETL